MCIDLAQTGNEKIVKPDTVSMQIDDGIVDLDEYEENTRTDDWNFEVVAGGSLIEHSPLISSDSRTLFVICNHVFRSFNVGTGEFEYDLKSEDGDIVGMQFSISRSNFLIACSKNGTLYHFRWTAGILDKKVKLPVKEVMRFSLIRHENSCVVNYVDEGKAKVSLFNYETGEFIYTFEMNLKPIPVLFGMPTEHHKFFIVGQKNKLNIVVDKKAPPYRQVINFQRNRLTIVVCHPSEECFATGDISGRIILWRDFIKSSKVEPTQEIYHWHPSPITAIAFSATGTFFYSGSADEPVLVKWTINDPNHKKFLPRMAAPITQIAVGGANARVAVTTKDNAIYIHDAQLDLQRTVQYFTYTADDGSGQEPFPVGLKVDPRTQTIALNGRVGHLQFFSTQTQSLLYNLDITLQNAVNKEQDRVLYNTRVTQVALNQEWMATAECWDDMQHSPEIRIKFWFFSESKQTFALSTSVESPHELPVTALEFSSPHAVTKLICASAGHDRVIRLWTLEQSQHLHKKSKVWMCMAQLTYKNLPIEALTFSRDTSLLVAGCGYVLCCWDTNSLKLKCTLNAPGGVDGNIGKVVLTVPMNPPKDAETRQTKNAQLVENYFKTGADELVKWHRSSEKRGTKKLNFLPEEHKKSAFKLIKNSTSLNVHQKIQALVKLEIPLKMSENSRKQLTKTLREREQRINQIRLSMITNIRGLKRHVQFQAHARYKAFAMNHAKENKDWFETFAVGVEQMDTDSATTKKQTVLEEPKFTAPTQIKHVIFGSEEHSHLVFVSTDDKILVWNLLTLRIVFSSFLEVTHVTHDEQTNLIAAFTRNNELHVFHISEPLSYFVREGMPNVHGAVWIPRRYPFPNTLLVNWQARSELYFFTRDQELMKLTNKRLTKASVPLPQMKRTTDILEPSTSYARMRAGQATSEGTEPITFSGDRIFESKEAAVAEILAMQCHTAPRMRYVVKNFLMSMIKDDGSATDRQNSSTSNGTKAEDHNEEKEEESSDTDDEDDPGKIKRMEKLKAIESNSKNQKKVDKEEERKRLERLDLEIDFSNMVL